MITPKEIKSLAYRCPLCGAGVISTADIRHFSDKLVRLKCSCGQSEMTMRGDGKGKVELSVPCLICPTPHRYTLTTDLMQRDLFRLNCPYGEDVPTLFIGEMNTVKASLAESELQLSELMEKNDFSDFSVFHGDAPEMSDPETVNQVCFVIGELDADGKIYCDCENGTGDYLLEKGASGVTVKCKKCAKSAYIPCDAGPSTAAFLDADSLTLI